MSQLASEIIDASGSSIDPSDEVYAAMAADERDQRLENALVHLTKQERQTWERMLQGIPAGRSEDAERKRRSRVRKKVRGLLGE